jgi:hypothetical protein
MSKLEVDTIAPQSGTTITVGESGDTVTIPTGVTLDASNATTTLPANVVTTDGTQTLTNKSIAATQLTGTITPSDNTVTPAKLAYNYNQFRNIIINGDMSIAQRGTSFSSISSGNSNYPVDRFRLNLGTAGTWTLSQDTTVPTGQGFAKSIKMDCTTANGSLSAGSYILLQQLIEGQNLQYLKKGTSSAESLTVSFWVYATKTGTNICELYDQDNTRHIAKSYTISSSNTWEKKTITFAGDTSGAFNNDNGASLELNFWLSAGTTYSSGTLATSWSSNTNANRAVGQVNHADSTSNNFYITGIQMEAGTTASDFEFLPVDVNLERCQRYFFNASPTYFIVGRWDADSGIPLGNYEFLKEMRAAPTFSTSGTFSTGLGYAGTPSAGNIQTKNCYLGGEDSISANAIRYIHSGTIELDAEL